MLSVIAVAGFAPISTLKALIMFPPSLLLSVLRGNHLLPGVPLGIPLKNPQLLIPLIELNAT